MVTRRDALMFGAALLAGCACPGTNRGIAASARLRRTGANSPSSDRIDVHQHVVPPVWVDGLRARKLPHHPPPWTPEAALRFMDAHGIAKGVLSLTAPGLTGWEASALRTTTRQINEYTADLARRWPDRFGNFACLPLPDIEGSIAEAGYALDALKAQGVVLYSNYGERYLGDPWLEPLWAELDRRAAVVFIHPTRLMQSELPGIPGPTVDFPFGTTRTAVQMVKNGVMDRYRRMRVILSHGGGFLPFAAYRLATFAASGPPGSLESPTFDTDTQATLATFRRFYLDTALSSSPPALSAIKVFADPSHLLFGSDFPYAPGGISTAFTTMLDDSPLLTADELAGINHGNADALFGGR